MSILGLDVCSWVCRCCYGGVVALVVVGVLFLLLALWICGWFMIYCLRVFIRGLCDVVVLLYWLCWRGYVVLLCCLVLLGVVVFGFRFWSML